MFKLLLMNSVAGLSAFLINYKLLRFPNFIDSAIFLFITYLAQIIITELALGISGALFINNLIALNILILLLVLFLTGKKDFCFFSGIKSAALELLSNKAILITGSLILGFGLVKIYINLINPPFGWDSLSYHFVFPVEWLKHGNLAIPITICDDPSPSYYPINGSLFFLWFMLPLKNVFLADLGQVPFFIIAFFSLYSISRKLKLDRELSFFAAGLFLITPNVFKQLEIAYVDVMLAALFFAALNFLLGLRREPFLKNLLLWSLCFGLFIGTKTSAVIYGAPLLLFFAFILFKNMAKQKFKNIFIYSGLFLIILLAWGSFSYLRNLIVTGNPLYPADITLLGMKLFSGVMPFATYRAHWGPEDFNPGKLLFGEGMGVQFILFVLPAAILSIPLIFIKLKDTAADILFILLLSPLLFTSFILFMPQFWVRYLYPFLGISFIAAMYMCGLCIPRAVLRVAVFICFVASVGEMASNWILSHSFCLSIFFMFALRAIIRRLNLKVFLITAVLTGAALYFLNINYDKSEFDGYLSDSVFPQEDARAWIWLNNNTDKSRIAYAGIPHVFPLYGSNFKNDVFYASVNGRHPAKLHYFPKAKYIWTEDYQDFHRSLEDPDNYRQNPDYSAWLRNLKAEKGDYLIVYSLRMVEGKIVFPSEDKWAGAHAESFEPAYTNSKVHIYRLVK